MATSTTQVEIGKSYKVPRGFELPFVGRFLKATKVWPGGVDFTAAGGNLVRLGPVSVETLVRNAVAVR
ncbi:hypothetical protein [Comamonas thiooxydans]|uniref:hypothetical protein n=1 Tax=Comamonas thiooxydans TaxID=363952 RepID=UPI000B417010|nr:hypothetical protein [Comamonas thiooxydans]